MAASSYEVKLSDDGTYIILTVVGEITSQSAMEQNVAAHAEGRKLGINRYLTDVRQARNMDSVVHNYQFAYDDMVSPDVDSTAVVALLVAPDDHSHDFVETFARNAGLSVTLFRDWDEAVNFLQQK
ncbi:MAG: hypothetical protein H6667_08115 [Ardenticatenaceae bacterium]|nr:hypothetical protein [Ardenticatenaceae bacterium]MCB9444685.1 hypothetical protein [Ardenticatenaceae bacterium]